MKILTHCPLCSNELSPYTESYWYQLLCQKCGVESNFMSYRFCAFYSLDKIKLFRIIVTLENLKITSTFDATFACPKGTAFFKNPADVPNRPIAHFPHPMPLNSSEDVKKANDFFLTALIFK